eukprot:GILK01009262.1.p1 GENE.GILK01009262.1~~GILK01009262.1.p1  ORF type:complete len:567 (-),score=88.57 GILK01009262.1:150-1850(-)
MTHLSAFVLLSLCCFQAINALKVVDSSVQQRVFQLWRSADDVPKHTQEQDTTRLVEVPDWIALEVTSLHLRFDEPLFITFLRNDTLVKLDLHHLATREKDPDILFGMTKLVCLNSTFPSGPPPLPVSGYRMSLGSFFNAGDIPELLVPLPLSPYLDHALLRLLETFGNFSSSVPALRKSIFGDNLLEFMILSNYQDSLGNEHRILDAALIETCSLHFLSEPYYEPTPPTRQPVTGDMEVNEVVNLLKFPVVSRNFTNQKGQVFEGSANFSSTIVHRSSVDVIIPSAGASSMFGSLGCESNRLTFGASDEDIQSFLEVELGTDSATAAYLSSGTQILNIIMKFVLSPIFEPILNPVVGLMGSALGPHATESMTHNFGAAIPGDVSEMLNEVLTANLTNMLTDSITDKVTIDLTKSLTDELGPYLTKSVSAKILPILHELLDTILEKTIPYKINLILPETLVRSLELTLTHSLTRSVTHALVPTLAHTLNHARQEEDHFCYSCYYHKQMCHLCKHSSWYGYYINYHSTYFSDYYGNFYADYYAKALELVDRAEHPQSDHYVKQDTGTV